MRKFLIASAAIAASIVTAAPASAVTMYVGGGPSRDCYQAARNQRGDNRALELCNESLGAEMLTASGRAATLVNRGIVYLNRGDAARAMVDFDAAIELDPNMAEGHTNRGLVLLRQANYQGAIQAISRGLELDPVEPEKAYYNRAVAFEELQNIRAAYADYRRAAELAPGWDVAQSELTRFRVR
jgi:tetratricopeptide (TPR) repeat protein